MQSPCNPIDLQLNVHNPTHPFEFNRLLGEGTLTVPEALYEQLTEATPPYRRDRKWGGPGRRRWHDALDSSALLLCCAKP